MAKNDEAGTEPEKVQCAVCKKLLPTSQAISPEGHEYVLYFCGGRCHAEWAREQAEAARGGASGAPEAGSGQGWQASPRDDSIDGAAVSSDWRFASVWGWPLSVDESDRVPAPNGCLSTAIGGYAPNVFDYVILM